MGYEFKSPHIHTLDGKPLIGTTTALGILSKPLTWWASGMACAEFGWLKSLENDRKATWDEKVRREEERKIASMEGYVKISDMTPKEYQALLDKAYRAHNTKKEKSADEGTDLHKLIENFIKGEITSYGVILADHHIQPFIDWSKKNVKRFLFSELHCYSRKLWVGGIADFGYEDMKGNLVLGDIKSSAEAYFSQWVQLSGYCLQIEENGGFSSSGELLMKPQSFKYHAIFALRAGLDKPFFNYDIQATREAFCHAVQLYKSKMFFEKEA